jgi:hypothetical protein
VPASLQDFLTRLDRSGALYTREDFERLFRRNQEASTAPDATYVFADLDGDGREEGYAAIGDGWWGKRHFLMAFDPADAGWRLAVEREIVTSTRGTPVLSALGGTDRPRLQMHYTSGWGTGISASTACVYERHTTGLVNVLTIETRREEISGANGPVLELGIGPITFTREEHSGDLLALAQARISFWTGKLGTLPESIEYEMPLRWRQKAAGLPFEPEAPIHPFLALGKTSDFFWHHAACTWFDRHGKAAVDLAAGADPTQASILRSVCSMAAQSGAKPDQTALAERLRAQLPAAPR